LKLFQADSSGFVEVATGFNMWRSKDVYIE